MAFGHLYESGSCLLGRIFHAATRLMVVGGATYICVGTRWEMGGLMAKKAPPIQNVLREFNQIIKGASTTEESISEILTRVNRELDSLSKRHMRPELPRPKKSVFDEFRAVRPYPRIEEEGELQARAEAYLERTFREVVFTLSKRYVDFRLMSTPSSLEGHFNYSLEGKKVRWWWRDRWEPLVQVAVSRVSEDRANQIAGPLFRRAIEAKHPKEIISTVAQRAATGGELSVWGQDDKH